ncbi:MAG: cysteine desulfurase, partial [Alphaproteobacteria bacterium]|nr:cysteine desulfurase [Alphaproteobacteria bacterium]
AYNVVLGRCSMCHAREPGYGNILWAPNGVLLETEGDVARHARQIFLQAGVSHAMPPGNVTWMEPSERAQIVRWYRSARQGG